MGRKKAHVPLNILINQRLVGRLLKAANGATSFQYHPSWLDWRHSFAISLSMPLRESAYAGAQVVAVFDNLLPDDPNVRSRVAERTGAQGADYYSLLEQIGRDCVGAMQFIPEDMVADPSPDIEAVAVSDAEIEAIIANLARAPLGIEMDDGFRISVAGAQEKTAFLRHQGRWMRPLGSTATTHIFKPQLGEIPTAFGLIDLNDSVDNEHYCLKLAAAFGLKTAATSIESFGGRRVLAVERFDRIWRENGQLLRLPQEDCCQALGIPPTQKYQSNGGPTAVQILKLLRDSDTPLADQLDFLKSQIIFWLIGATDGHGKNFSIFLKPGGRYGLTPFYDILSAQSAFDQKQIPQNKFKLAMSVGNSRKYRLSDIAGRHFVETGKEAGLGMAIIEQAFTEIRDRITTAPDAALAQMPADFAEAIHDTIVAAIKSRMKLFDTGFAELRGGG